MSASGPNPRNSMDADNLKSFNFSEKNQFPLSRPRKVADILIGKYEDLFRHDDWNVGIIFAPIQAFLEQGSNAQIHWLPPPGQNRFLADPFGIVKNGKTFVLCEEYDYSTSKGRIVSYEIAKGGEIANRVLAMESQFHLSYPYLIQHEGSVYCVPETGHAREVAIFRAEDFPTRWVKVATLIDDFAALDSTIFKHEGMWWLTCSGKDHGSLHTLFIWYAEELLGPWIPHKANPVKLDIRSSRPAGTPFERDDCLYRPAQDNSRTYGGRVILNRVRKLSPTDFKEEQVAVIEPNQSGPYPDGLHTVSSLDNMTLVDGKRLRFVSAAFKRTMMRRVRFYQARANR